MDRVLKCKKRIGILPFVMPLMLALTSCSTISSHQPMAVTTGVGSAHQVQVAHHQAQTGHHIQKHHAKVISSTHSQPYQPHAPVQVAHPKQQPVKHEMHQPKIVSPFETLNTKTTPIQYTQSNPANGQYWLLSVPGVDLNSGAYKNIGGRSAIIVNIRRLDYLDGKHHYIQTARWDGGHVSQSYINATQAELMAILGLSILENGYIETAYGTTIMMFAGNGHIYDIPGHRFELIVIRAASAPAGRSPVKPAPTGPRKNGGSQQGMNNNSVSQLENYNFTIGENEVVTVLESKLGEIAATENALIPSVLSSVENQASAETLIKQCSTRVTDATDFAAKSHCALSEAMNAALVMQLTSEQKTYCMNNNRVIEAVCIADFGNRTLSASID